MPIYEYQCDGCNAVFEVFQKVSDPAPASHACGSTQVHRILSNTSFVLKGTGWYATDYGDKSKKGDDAGNKAAKKNDSGGKDSKDTKAEAKATGEPGKGATSAASGGASGQTGNPKSGGGTAKP